MKKYLFLSIIYFVLTPLFAQENEVTFSEDFKRAHDGKVTIEINEVQELAHIMMTISTIGLEDTNMINHKNEYHQNVINRFSSFRNHKAIGIVDSLLKESVIYYIFLSSNASGFKFEGNTLIRTNIYNFPAKQVGVTVITEDPILKYQKEFEDFALVSGFRTFFAEQKPIYDQIKIDYHQYGEIDKQKDWLEQAFDYKINSYRVLTSPLIGGINATHTFEDNNFKETLLYLPIITNRPDLTKEKSIAMNSRVIFTEIDHNYVGPMSEKHKVAIESIFDNRSFWVNSSNKSTMHYPNPIKVFDEYMTWGLFILYVSDIFPNNQELLSYVVDHVNSKMVDKGFPKAKAFNKELFRLYKIKSNNQMAELYTGILAWSSTQL
ncbi:MAG: DUF4932 domain-containing protein [Sphingobacterium sp.]